MNKYFNYNETCDAAKCIEKGDHDVAERAKATFDEQIKNIECAMKISSSFVVMIDGNIKTYTTAQIYELLGNLGNLYPSINKRTHYKIVMDYLKQYEL